MSDDANRDKGSDFWEKYSHLNDEGRPVFKKKDPNVLELTEYDREFLADLKVGV